MKRRSFVRSAFIASAVPAAVVGQQTGSPANTPQQQPTPQPNTPARQVSRQPQAMPDLDVTQAELTAEDVPHFFTAKQFATLTKLGGILLPPLKSNPGALDAKAPEFLDFLLSVSPAARQKLYQQGLDALGQQAKKEFKKDFSELDATQADAVLRPLLVVRPWPQDMPKDPVKNFLAQVHDDLRTATVNSREWAAATAKSGRRFTRGFSGSGQYWAPIDPIS